MNFLIGVSVIIVGFFVLYRWRKGIAGVIRTVPLPVFALYVLSSIPFIFAEESINCIYHGDGRGCTLTPWIIGVLVIEITILGLIVRRKHIQSIKRPMVLFGLFGALWELFFGGLRGAVGPSLFFVFMFVYVMVSYAFLVVVPLTVLLENKTQR